MAVETNEKQAAAPVFHPKLVTCRTVQVTPEVIVDVRDGSGDSLLLTQIKLPPIPKADPEGRGRSPGQRLDDALDQAEADALRQWDAARQQQRQGG